MLTELKRSLGRHAPTVATLFRLARNEWSHLTGSFGDVWGFPVAGASSLMLAGKFESDERDFAAELLSQSNWFVDIGANIGLYSLLASSTCSEVVAVEPLMDNLRFLYKNLDHNRAHNVTVLPVAVGEHSGLLELHGGSTGASAIEGWAGAPAEMRRLVSMLTMDQVSGLLQGGGPGLIKIDVEGFELQVLRGARGVAERRDVRWIVEICLQEMHPKSFNPHFADTFEFFWSLGYSSRFATTSGPNISRSDVDRWFRSRSWSPPSNNILFWREPARR